MLFNSLEFAAFLPLVFFIYWFVLGPHLRAQNLFVLVASYVFYSWWDWRFLSLIVASSLVDYFAGLGIDRSENQRGRRVWLSASLTVNLGALAVFKYFGFFVESLRASLRAAGVDLELRALDIVLPVGISFYTFQTLSYTIDVYRGRLSPTRDWLAFFGFVAFFPQLVAGPIERASNLLPQFEQARRFDLDSARTGLRLILWGLFKKVVIADNCAVYVDTIFAGYADQRGSTLALGLVYFAFQIYGDFSGYSDIARGVARLLGFRLMRNFDMPYFSRDIGEFWRRWHISLSTWFRDYVYVPLGGSRRSAAIGIRNVLVVFLVSGLWHGANWTFALWGLLNAVYFLPLFWSGRRSRASLATEARGALTTGEFARMCMTFGLTTFAWVFFRSPDIGTALAYSARLLSPTLLSMPSHVDMLPAISGFLLWEWTMRGAEHGLEFTSLRRGGRWVVYLVLLDLVVLYGNAEKPFIYFQF